MAILAPTFPSPAELRFSRACYVAALVVTLVWGFVYVRFGNPGLCDEPGHLLVIEHYAAGKPGWPETMTTPPGYHLTVDWLTPGFPTMTSARLVTLGYALLAGVAFAGAWRRFHGRPAGPATLLLALLPILQPFTAMAYSDVPGLAVLLLAWWAQLARRFALAAGLLAAASLVRQTNLVWGGFFLVFEFTRAANAPLASRVDWRAALLAVLSRGRWLLLVVATAAGVILVTGKTTPGTNHGNALQPNLATLFFAGVLILGLGLPVWLAGLPAAVRAGRAALRGASSTTGGGERRGSVARAWLILSLTVITALGAIAWLAFNYRNPHVWNRELWWPEVSFTLLRNWPLVWFEQTPARHLLAAVGVVLAALALGVTFVRQRHGRELWLTLPFAAVLLFSNLLVEPRYFITPAAFVLFFIEWNRRAFWWLAPWWALLVVAHAPFIVTAKSLW